MIYAPYYYYGCGLNAFCMSLENPRKFISVNQTKSSRGNPYLAWGRTHSTWLVRQYRLNNGEHMLLHLIQQIQIIHKILRFITVVPITMMLLEMIILRGTTDITNKTGNYSLEESRTGLHGGYYTTCYPAIMQIDWWGNTVITIVTTVVWVTLVRHNN